MTRASLIVLLEELVQLAPRPEEQVAIEHEMLEALTELARGEKRVREGALLS